MIGESDTPVHFYKVKAHTGVVKNEFVGAIAKHAALHEFGHADAFLPFSHHGMGSMYMIYTGSRNF